MSHDARAPGRDDDCRCACGSLLGRLVDGGVELKCRRCKRTTWIPLAADWRRPAARPERSLRTALTR